MASSAPTVPPSMNNFRNSGFQYNTVFSFERNFNHQAAISWMLENWTSSFWFSCIYVLVIFSGRWYMSQRDKFELRPYLATWSGILAIFSILTTARLLSEAIYIVYTYGWDYSVCYPSVYYSDSAIWMFLFSVSKVYELGDTLFIVLRKQPLIFLHWYHHVTVLIFSWYTYAYFQAPGRWYAAVNGLVHSFMYSYYCLRALRIRLPKAVSVGITVIQIGQMLFGMYVTYSAYAVKQSNDQCHVSYSTVKYALLMYGSYFLLFGNFFVHAYLLRKPVDRALKKES